MSSPRVLVSLLAEQVEIEGDAAHHLFGVLRVRPGDRLVVFDGSGSEADALVEEAGARRVLLNAGPPRRSATEPDLEVHCHPALVKHADRFGEMVRSLVELGAGSITPLLTERSVTGPPSEARLERWRRVAAEAARQSGRAVVPEVRPVRTLGEVALAEGVAGLVGDLGGPPPRVPAGGRGVVLVTGPEGGLTPGELSWLCARGFERAGLGPRTLRADTAAVALLAAVTAARGR